MKIQKEALSTSELNNTSPINQKEVNKKRLILATVAASVGGISMFAPAFAQGGNMTDGGNTTEGSMPSLPPDTSG